MARRSSFMNDLARAARAAERAEKSRRRAQQQAAKQLEQMARAEQRARAAYAKAQARTQKELEKERARLYTEARIAEVELKNATLVDAVAELESILQATLEVDDYIDLNTLKVAPEYPGFTPPPHLTKSPPKPRLEDYLPPPLTTAQKLIPGAKGRYEKLLEQAKGKYGADIIVYDYQEQKRKAELQRLKQDYDDRVQTIRETTAQQHAEIDRFIRDLSDGKPDAIVNYCALVIESSVYPDDFPQRSKAAYVPESKQLVVEYDLPTIDVIPEIALYKYVKTKDEITSTARAASQRKSLYASVIAQITLRTLHELFEADRLGHIETIVFNGYVDTVDKGTGRDVRVCLVTVRTSREVFTALDLSRVEPEACLKTLNAAVSKSAAELAPVRPVLEFDMVDPRFVEETDVISSLDQRTNLMELTPLEFESLITNLFQKMGLESRQTQASRDGGVDCVAYDPRPIFGGKVVIQAKRYKNTVGVSAVRDLFGTLQNEGASKGILVTTSGYGKAAYEFAEGKPLELLSGSNLLYLLKEHAGVDAKIEVPSTWKEPILDVEALD